MSRAAEEAVVRVSQLEKPARYMPLAQQWEGIVCSIRRVVVAISRNG